MRVRSKHGKNGSGLEMSVERLIELSASDRDGRVEQLEAQVDALVRVVAALIERGGYTDEEVLKIIGVEWMVEPDV